MRLVLEVVGDRTSKFGSSRVGGHVQNSALIVRSVVQDGTINRAWSWADKSRDWSGDSLGDHAIGRAIWTTVSRLAVRSIAISGDWLHDLKISRVTSRHLLVVLY